MPFLFDKQGRLVRKDGSLVHRPKIRRGKRSVELSGRVSHLRVDFLLGGSGPVRDEYEKLLDNPTTLLKDLRKWFAARGHSVTLSAINRHRRRYLVQFISDRNAARVASAYCTMTRREGPGVVGEASLAKFEMMVMQKLFKMEGAPEKPDKEWVAEAKMLHLLADARRMVENVRLEYLRKAAAASEAVQTMHPGDIGKRTAEKVREIFGV